MASSLPPAMASPATTATTGRGKFSMACNMSSMGETSPGLAALSLRSRPAQNTGPSARMTATRSPAPGGAVNAALTAAIISPSSALRFSGRLRSTRRTAPATSRVTLAMPVSLDLEVGELDKLGVALGILDELAAHLLWGLHRTAHVDGEQSRLGPIIPQSSPNHPQD